MCAQQRLRSAWASFIPVWSESSMSAWRKLGSLAAHCARSEDSDQTGQMPRLIWVFAGRTVISLVLSCCGSNSWIFSGDLCSGLLKIYCVAWLPAAVCETFTGYQWETRPSCVSCRNLYTLFPVLNPFSPSVSFLIFARKKVTVRLK